MTKPKAIVKPAPARRFQGKWFAILDDNSRYLRHDMTLHHNMTGEGGTYFDTREEAQELADRFNGDLPHKDTPKTWGEMTDAEKGALLLAHHEGKVVESDASGSWTTCEPQWRHDARYRVRPEPKRETENVTIVNFDGVTIGRGTVVTENGKPDWASIRMEALDND